MHCVLWIIAAATGEISGTEHPSSIEITLEDNAFNFLMLGDWGGWPAPVREILSTNIKPNAC